MLRKALAVLAMATLMIAVLATAWWSVRQFTSIVVLAILLAYILSPVIGLVSQRLRLSPPSG